MLVSDIQKKRAKNACDDGLNTCYSSLGWNFKCFFFLFLSLSFFFVSWTLLSVCIFCFVEFSLIFRHSCHTVCRKFFFSWNFFSSNLITQRHVKFIDRPVFLPTTNRLYTDYIILKWLIVAVIIHRKWRGLL